MSRNGADVPMKALAEIEGNFVEGKVEAFTKDFLIIRDGEGREHCVARGAAYIQACTMPTTSHQLGEGEPLEVTAVRLNSNGGHWQASWFDRKGIRRRKALGPKDRVSRGEAEQACERIQDTINRRVETYKSMRGWLEKYKQIRFPDLGTSTQQSYESTMKLLERFMPDESLDTLTRMDAAEFRTALRDEIGLGEHTTRKHVRQARLIFEEAVRHDVCEVNPFDRQKAGAVRLDKDWHYVPREDLAGIIEAMDNQDHELMLAICRLAGLRLGEVLRLKWEHIDWSTRRLTVWHEGAQTTKCRRRVVPIDPWLHDVLAARMPASPAQGRVVHLKPTSKTVNRDALRRKIRCAGFEPWPRLFHTLRKNCETDWLAKYPPMDVCDWMGHDPRVAAMHYHQTTQSVWDQATGKHSTGAGSA